MKQHQIQQLLTGLNEKPLIKTAKFHALYKNLHWENATAALMTALELSIAVTAA